MASSLFLVLILSSVVLVHLAKQDDCQPGYVINLAVNGNNTLTWERSPNEQCEIDHYIVEVSSANGTIRYSYTVSDPILEIDHLESCESYTFRVYQVSSDNITGAPWAIYTVTPPASDANLGLDSVNLVQEGRHVRLNWTLQQEYIRCATRYRVVVYNEDSDIVHDVYTSLTSVYINNVVPCAHYDFTVRALFTLEEEGPITLLHHVAHDDVATAPQLINVTLASTSVTLTWHLEEYWRNRCPIYALLIYGSPYFTAAYRIRDQANRTPLPLSITGLSPDTMYFLNVTANNTAGLSDSFLVAVQTLGAN